MVVTDERKKAISDVAIGLSVNSRISVPDQIAALRKQLDLVLAANPKITICDEYKKFSDIVSEKKSKATR